MIRTVPFCLLSQIKNLADLTLNIKSAGFLVGVTGFEPAASTSQMSRATNCATPRF